MKKILSKSAILLLSIPLFTMSAIGQNSVYDISTLTTTSSLVRNHVQNGDVIYNENAVRSFSYVDLTTSLVTNAVVPNLQLVSDMEIVNETLYFCGVYAGEPVIGRFDIGNFFWGGGSAEIIPVSSVAPGSIFLNKLEVYFRSQNEIGRAHV